MRNATDLLNDIQHLVDDYIIEDGAGSQDNVISAIGALRIVGTRMECFQQRRIERIESDARKAEKRQALWRLDVDNDYLHAIYSIRIENRVLTTMTHFSAEDAVRNIVVARLLLAGVAAEASERLGVSIQVEDLVEKLVSARMHDHTETHKAPPAPKAPAEDEPPIEYPEGPQG